MAPPSPAGKGRGPTADDELYEHAPCALLVTTPDGVVRRANDTFCRWVGRSAESMVGQVRVQDLLTTGSRIFHQTHWAPLLQIQGSVAEIKLELRGPDGSAIPAVVNAVRREHDGTVRHEIALFVAEDRHRYERELLIARRRAEELLLQEQHTRAALVAAQAEAEREHATAEDRALFAEQMMGIVSHDLRNPLAVIHMSGHILGLGDLTAPQRAALQRLTNSTNLALRLIAELLDFTSARLGRGLPLVRKTVDLHALVADSVEDLRLSHPGRTIVHRRAGAAACSASSDRIVQLVGNLVSNAARHGSADGPITVESAVDGGRCRVRVHNHGAPVAPEMLEAMFEPMVRGPDRRPGEGIGLGLFIVREIARAHGGTVDVRSDAAAGTTFTVEFPTCDDAG